MFIQTTSTSSSSSLGKRRWEDEHDPATRSSSSARKLLDRRDDARWAPSGAHSPSKPESTRRTIERDAEVAKLNSGTKTASSSSSKAKEITGTMTIQATSTSASSSSGKRRREDPVPGAAYSPDIRLPSGDARKPGRRDDAPSRPAPSASESRPELTDEEDSDSEPDSTTRTHKDLSKVKKHHMQSLGAKWQRTGAASNTTIMKWTEKIWGLFARDPTGNRSLRFGHEFLLAETVQRSWLEEKANIEQGVRRKMNVGRHPESWVSDLVVIIMDSLVMRSQERMKYLKELPLSWSEKSIRKDDAELKRGLSTEERASMENPTILTQGNFELSVTGRLDFFTVRMLKPDASHRGYKKRLLHYTTLDEVAVGMNLKELQGIGLFLVEVKALGQTRLLEGHLPQMIAEALITLSRKWVSWCLTSGSRWLFGVTFKGRRQGSITKYLESAPLPLVPGLGDYDVEAVMEKMEGVWRLLTLWNYADPKTLEGVVLLSKTLSVSD
ncbi:hypothetical protein DFP72DRAFT_908675 [Ephemerocybe angulata]|uniref:Uncharacterized protein n=1 Tax=Ephemerocybe angulata TaxID=980116 RepID=A0A8H6HSQ1_9AGAR|nr:hypothetical protein DFP72DRAFT_908675 [Tulosesus angulatus]